MKIAGGQQGPGSKKTNDLIKKWTKGDLYERSPCKCEEDFWGYLRARTGVFDLRPLDY